MRDHVIEPYTFYHNISIWDIDILYIYIYISYRDKLISLMVKKSYLLECI